MEERGFSTVVADSQFSTLGLMLIGSLARFWSVLRKIAGDVGVELDAQDGNDITPVAMHQKSDQVGEVVSRNFAQKTDLGERVERTGDPVDNKEEADETVDGQLKEATKKEKKGRKESSEEAIKYDATLERRPRKKKKKNDAFDDLFGNLI
jgi:ribonuclease MRP protein subunit RMP1